MAEYDFSEDPVQESAFQKRLKRGIGRAGQVRAQQEGEAVSESLARGLTGSSLEAGLRGRATAQEAESISELESGLSQEAAAQDLEARRLKEARQYATSERVGSQQYGTQERLGGEAFAGTQAQLGREYGTQERLGAQAYGTGEREASQLFGALEAEKGRTFESAEAQKARNDAFDEALRSRDFAAAQALLGRQFTTSEREAAEKYGTGEREAAQTFGAGEALKSRTFQAGEAEKGRTFSAEQDRLAREAMAAENERQRKADIEADLATGGLGLAARWLGGQYGGGGGAGVEYDEQGNPIPGGRVPLGGGLLTRGGGVLGGGGLTRAGMGGTLAGLGAGYAGGRIARATGLTGGEQSRATTRARKAGEVGGTVLGSLFGPVGGALGGALGGKAAVTYTRAAESVGKALKKVCFAWDTPISLENGLWMPISMLSLGDKTKGGGEVLRTSNGFSDDLYDYLGIFVTGSHAVLENGEWIRVRNSIVAKKHPGRFRVYSLVNETHRLYVNGLTFADEFETDQYEDVSAEASLKILNGTPIASNWSTKEVAAKIENEILGENSCLIMESAKP